jgi:pimeloyl-ACP methyl ester carboxylesterase
MSQEQPFDLYLLHGWASDPDNEDKWRPLMGALSKQGIEASFLGLPGLSTPLDEVWQLDDYVEWLANQLPSNRSVRLLGHSFGGQIAIRFAALYPDRVKQLILIDASGLRDHSLKAVVKRRAFWLAAKVGKLVVNGDRARRQLPHPLEQFQHLRVPDHHSVHPVRLQGLLRRPPVKLPGPPVPERPRQRGGRPVGSDPESGRRLRSRREDQ